MEQRRFHPCRAHAGRRGLPAHVHDQPPRGGSTARRHRRPPSRSSDVSTPAVTCGTPRPACTCSRPTAISPARKQVICIRQSNCSPIAPAALEMPYC